MTTAERADNKQNVMVRMLYSSLVIFKALILGVKWPLNQLANCLFVQHSYIELDRKKHKKISYLVLFEKKKTKLCLCMNFLQLKETVKEKKKRKTEQQKSKDSAHVGPPIA